ncbi:MULTISPECIES: MmyB family transcriptional regulator [Streptomyces]|uniref:Helix-turn-helix transcriptional regulator n=1 Tax=Streptomyces longisporus TaxID=1948 RepID=A0ABN3N7F5_STRLO
MPDPSSSAQELAAFLRSRRAQVSPEQVGLPRGEGRRTKGLRRSEVAALAGVSVGWYTWLEQARARPTTAVLSALAGALQLADNERRYLLSFADASTPPERRPLQRPVASVELLALVHTMMPNPAFILDENWDFLAWNDAYTALTMNLADLPAQHRNFLWLLLRWPEYRRRNVEWEREARSVVGQFRTSYHHNRRYDPRADEVASMILEDENAAHLWQKFHVQEYAPGVITFLQPDGSAQRYRHVKMQTLDVQRLRVVVYLAL